jgi:hypothetical protein
MARGGKPRSEQIRLEAGGKADAIYLARVFPPLTLSGPDIQCHRKSVADGKADVQISTREASPNPLCAHVPARELEVQHADSGRYANCSAGRHAYASALTTFALRDRRR